MINILSRFCICFSNWNLWCQLESVLRSESRERRQQQKTFILSFRMTSTVAKVGESKIYLNSYLLWQFIKRTLDWLLVWGKNEKLLGWDSICNTKKFSQEKQSNTSLCFNYILTAKNENQMKKNASLIGLIEFFPTFPFYFCLSAWRISSTQKIYGA